MRRKLFRDPRLGDSLRPPLAACVAGVPFAGRQWGPAVRASQYSHGRPVLPNTASTGLTLNYSNPARPGLPGNVFENAMTGDTFCSNAGARSQAEIYTWPASGTTADINSGFNYYNYLTGC